MRLINVKYRISVVWFSQTANLLRERLIMVINIACNPDGWTDFEGVYCCQQGLAVWLETWLEVLMQTNLHHQQLIITDFFLVSILGRKRCLKWVCFKGRQGENCNVRHKHSSWVWCPVKARGASLGDCLAGSWGAVHVPCRGGTANGGQSLVPCKCNTIFRKADKFILTWLKAIRRVAEPLIQ